MANGDSDGISGRYQTATADHRAAGVTEQPGSPNGNLASMLLSAAEVLVHGREIQTQEIDLWIQHLQPVWKSSKESMEKALFEWDKVFRSHGLAESSGSLEVLQGGHQSTVWH
jgi:hypothetical protein